MTWSRSVFTEAVEAITVSIGNKTRRILHSSDICETNIDIDPFQTHRISPNDISDYTGRPYPPVKNRYRSLGTVLAGDWDNCDIENLEFVNESYRARYDLYLGETFSTSIFYKSLEEHFIEGVDWENTELVERSLQLIDSGEPAWRGAESEEQIYELCDSTDRLYESIAENGYLSQKDLGNNSVTRVVDEVCVDLDRNGEPLFVDGKHRLAIAKILNVNEMPVTVLVRHKKWVSKLEDGYTGSKKLY